MANAYEHPSAKDVAEKELREVVASTEALLAALGKEAGPEVEELRSRLTATIADLKQQLGPSFLASAREKIHQARDTAASIDEFVQTRPWTSVAIGTALGMLIGMAMKD